MCKFAVYSNSPLLPPKKNKFAPIPVGFHFSIFLGRWSSVVIEKVGFPLRACVDEDKVRLARSHWVRKRRIARWFPAMSWSGAAKLCGYSWELSHQPQ